MQRSALVGSERPVKVRNAPKDRPCNEVQTGPAKLNVSSFFGSWATWSLVFDFGKDRALGSRCRKCQTEERSAVGAAALRRNPPNRSDGAPPRGKAALNSFGKYGNRVSFESDSNNLTPPRTHFPASSPLRPRPERLEGLCSSVSAEWHRLTGRGKNAREFLLTSS